MGLTAYQKPLRCPNTGCSSAWLERYVRDVEVVGSNPVSPTNASRHQKIISFRANGSKVTYATALRMRYDMVGAPDA